MSGHFATFVGVLLLFACGGADRHAEAPATTTQVSAATEAQSSPLAPAAPAPSARVDKNPALRPSLRSPEMAELRSNMMHAPLRTGDTGF